MLTLNEQRAQLSSMRTGELVAYWNIMQINRCMMSNEEARSQFRRHLPIVDRLLIDREVAHEAGKLIQRSAA